MKPAATEHDIQSAIIDLLTMRGFLVLRVNSGAMLDENSGKRRFVQFIRWRVLGAAFQTAGVSDILALEPGGVFWAIEVKRPGKQPTDAQRRFLQAVNERGGIGLVAADPMDVEMCIADRLPFDR